MNHVCLCGLMKTEKGKEFDCMPNFFFGKLED